MTYKNFPLKECMRIAGSVVADGWTIHQKFTCSNCGSRQRVTEANVFIATGTCEECGAKTDIRKTGCNYSMEKGIKHD